MTSPTVVLDVLDALTGTLRAALDCPVIDGPPDIGDPLPLAVIVGYDGDSDDGRAGGVAQEWRTLGPEASRDETGDVVCAVWAQSGDEPFWVLRSRVRGVLVAVQEVLRAAPTLDVEGLLWVQLRAADLFQGDADGNVVRLVFYVSFMSVI